MLFALISPFLGKKTKDKIVLIQVFLLFKSYTELKKYFDDDCILKEMGGKSDFDFASSVKEGHDKINNINY